MPDVIQDPGRFLAGIAALIRNRSGEYLLLRRSECVKANETSHVRFYCPSGSSMGGSCGLFIHTSSGGLGACG